MQQTVDIQRIMAEIRHEIESKGLRNTVLPFENVHATPFETVTEYDPVRFSQLVSEMDRLKQIYAYRQLQSRQNILGKFILFFKKVIRKMSKFYIEPIVSDQNNFNANVVQGMQSVRAYMKRPVEDQAALWQAIRELRAENIELKSRIAQLETQKSRVEG